MYCKLPLAHGEFQMEACSCGNMAIIRLPIVIRLLQSQIILNYSILHAINKLQLHFIRLSHRLQWVQLV